jgi:hypothetical protein
MRRLIGIMAALIPFLAVGFSPYYVPTICSFFLSYVPCFLIIDIGPVVFALGSLVCLGNVYLSFIRPWIYKARHGTFEGCRFISVTPLFGTIGVMIGGIALSERLWIVPLALILMAVDIGGFHWFVYSTWKDDSLWNPKKAA